MLAVSACGGDTEPQPPAAESSQLEVIEPATTKAVAVSSTAAAPAASTTAAPPASTTAAAGELSPFRAEAELAVAARLAEDAPGSVTDEQIACVASATVGALDEERLSEIVAALAGPSAAVLPAGIVSDLERDRIVDAAAGCLPWTQTILESLHDLPDVPPAVLECAQAAAPSVETDRAAADIVLFGGEFVTVLNLVLPPDCLPQTAASQADTPAGRLTAAQLMLAGVSAESAACVAEQVDALGGMPSGESDTDESDTDAAMAAEQAIVAMMLGCLTPEEMALLSGPGGSQADTPAGRLTPDPGEGLVALLDRLPVVVEQPDGYDRDLFRHWIDADGDGCDTRREVLIAEAVTAPTVGGGCALSGGVWVSRYDALTETGSGRGFDIDHLVPLKEAWESGAHSWDSQDRERFANDLGYEHSLVGVSAGSNRSKGAQDPTTWLPPEVSQRCWYTAAWIHVKVRWGLSVDAAEADTLRDIISDCPDDAADAALPAPTVTTVTTTSASDEGCHPDYSPCIPYVEGDALNCGDLTAAQKPVTVLVVGVDPYRLDRDGDGQGCTS